LALGIATSASAQSPAAVSAQAGQTGTASFTLAGSSPFTPPDILSQVRLLGAGTLLPSSTICVDAAGRVFPVTGQPTLHEPVLIQGCGWPGSRTVSLTVVSPLGRSESMSAPAAENQFQFTYRTEPADTAGNYTVLLSSPGAPPVSGILQMRKAARPRLYTYENDASTILLSGFRSGEFVRLFQYCDNAQGTLVMTRWQFFQADTQGNLGVGVDSQLQTLPTRCFYITVGTISGEVPQFSAQPIFGGSIVTPSPQPPTFPTPIPPPPIYPTPIPPAVLPTAIPLPTAAPVITKAQLVSPLSGSVVQGVVPFYGSASIPNFSYYKFELLDARCANGVCFIAEFKQPVVDGKLMDLDTRTLPNGTHLLQMRVVDRQGVIYPSVPKIQLTIVN
jgi:hypothetical protein